MPADARSSWNERYGHGEGRDGASPWLVSLDPLLPRSGRALDVAGGAGANALWLASRGLEVTLVDISDVAVERAAAAAAAQHLPVTAVRADLEAAPLPPGPWDVVVCIHYLQRSLFPSLTESLSPGGWFVAEIATRRNRERHERPPPDFLLDEGELLTLITGLDIVSFDEGWHETGRHEARLVARRAEV